MRTYAAPTLSATLRILAFNTSLAFALVKDEHNGRHSALICSSGFPSQDEGDLAPRQDFQPSNYADLPSTLFNNLPPSLFSDLPSSLFPSSFFVPGAPASGGAQSTAEVTRTSSNPTEGSRSRASQPVSRTQAASKTSNTLRATSFPTSASQTSLPATSVSTNADVSLGQGSTSEGGKTNGGDDNNHLEIILPVILGVLAITAFLAFLIWRRRRRRQRQRDEAAEATFRNEEVISWSSDLDQQTSPPGTPGDATNATVAVAYSPQMVQNTRGVNAQTRERTSAIPLHVAENSIHQPSSIERVGGFATSRPSNDSVTRSVPPMSAVSGRVVETSQPPPGYGRWLAERYYGNQHGTSDAREFQSPTGGARGPTGEQRSDTSPEFRIPRRPVRGSTA